VAHSDSTRGSALAWCASRIRPTTLPGCGAPKLCCGSVGGRPASRVADLLHASRQAASNWRRAPRAQTDPGLAGRWLGAPRSGRPATALGSTDPSIDAVIDAGPRGHGHRSAVRTAPPLQRYPGEGTGLS
jgi:hypothetical protein